jgi:hypothetical protein
MPKTEPLHTELLASRQKLLTQVFDALQNMDSPTTPLLLVFWGSRGSGKTTFLKEAEKRLSSDPDVGIAGVWNLRDDEFSKLPELILDAVKAHTAKHKVIILDNLEALLQDVTGSDFFDFENKAILPLIEREDTLILAGSQIELNLWQEYDVRFRQCNYHLAPLSPEEVKQMLEGTTFDEQAAYQLTFGQPKMISTHIAKPRWTEKQISDYAVDYFLEGFPAEAKEIARVASLLPAFNMYVLRKVRGDEKNEDEGLLNWYHDNVNELTRRWMVQFDIDIGAYRFTDNAVRRLLSTDYLLSKPDQYDRIQSIAAEYYEEEAKGAAFLPQLIVSAVYHQVQTNRALSQAKRGDLCVSWIKRMRNFWNGANWEQVLSMWESGLNSNDLKDEIMSLIGEKHFKKITQMFLDYKREMEV